MTRTLLTLLSFSLLLAACGDAEPNTRRDRTNADANTNADADADADGNTDADADADGNTDADADSDGDDDTDDFVPADTRELSADEGALTTTFVTRAEQAVNGESDLPREESAITPIYATTQLDIRYDIEWRCQMEINRVEVYAPSDSPLIYHETNAPDGVEGQVILFARQAQNTGTREILATLDYLPGSSDQPLVFDEELLADLSPAIAHGIAFQVEGATTGQVALAEVRFFGRCMAPEMDIQWETTDWVCTGLTCELPENEGGVLEREVGCYRDTGIAANEALCAGERPPTEGDACSLSCPYNLTFIGYREFTYANDSGWLHEGNLTRRAGPLPSDVAFGTTLEAIEDKPCSIQTTTPDTYFVGISCTGDDDLYCAFRCN